MPVVIGPETCAGEVDLLLWRQVWPLFVVKKLALLRETAQFFGAEAF